MSSEAKYNRWQRIVTFPLIGKKSAKRTLIKLKMIKVNTIIPYNIVDQKKMSLYLYDSCRIKEFNKYYRGHKVMIALFNRGNNNSTWVIHEGKG